MNTLTRRHFLQATTATLLTAPAARAIEPLGRTGPARLQLSLAAYSFREFFAGELQRGAGKKGPAPGASMDMFKFLDFCAERDGVQFRAFTYDTNVAAAAAVPA